MSLNAPLTIKPRIKYKALDLACAQLGTAGRSHSIRKIIAQRIIKAVEKGERDPTRLCIFGLAALGPVIVHSRARPAQSTHNFRQRDSAF
jgi:hypothetical protein